MVNIADVARHAGVSRSTVSYVLSGKRRISSETRQRVLNSIESLGFRPDPAALALTTRRTSTIALAATIRLDAPDIDAAALRDFVMAIAFRLRGYGYDMLLLAQPADEQMERLRRGLLTDGLIVMDVLADDERLPVLRQTPFPVVLMGVAEDDGRLGAIDLDYRQAGLLAIGHLSALGHRRIALVSGPAGLGSVARLESGARSAVGQVPGARLTVIAGQTATAGAIADELETISECTAVILHDQHQLPALLDAISGAGITVPDELSVIAVATDGALRYCRPVTAISVPVDAIVSQVVDAIMAAVRTGASTRGLIPARLTDRGTTAAPRAAAGDEPAVSRPAG